ncbi:RNA polymerase sigma factor [Aquimarina intermedia]|uniref:RNA polymerase sigma-70 factor (ECF subfamily) n=1 Tax=Aquimarina intermedia TaxID=350814 RepID=A0A5S5C4Z6_9FLAO|nr:sigma-70 family RNA polymerase sigma factor [Aquimarina intermedia]TYP74404.1 RNA polymerase sigma-70 factor (ECF subfamily) [Aquimarina intermedia]
MGDKIQDSDIELITKVRNGDLNAFRSLVNLYKDKSLSLAVSIVKNETVAEDILQDVFMKMSRNIGTFKFKSKFSTWLYKIVVNTCYTELKKKKNNISLEENEGAIYYVSVMEEVPSLKLEDQQLYIHKAMKRLKADEALVLRLFYLCEMSLKEIEIITKFSTSKIRVDLHRGRKNLHLILKQLLGDEIDNLL